MPVMTLTEAARELGYATRSQLKRLKDNGRIDDFIVREGRKELIQTDGLSDHIGSIIRTRVNGNVCQPAPKDVVDEWTEIAAVVDQWIAPSTFGAPPFSSDRLATLCRCINDAVQRMSPFAPRRVHSEELAAWLRLPPRSIRAQRLHRGCQH